MMVDFQKRCEMCEEVTDAFSETCVAVKDAVSVGTNEDGTLDVPVPIAMASLCQVLIEIIERSTIQTPTMQIFRRLLREARGEALSSALQQSHQSRNSEYPHP